MSRRLTLSVNAEQAEVIDRLLARGELGEDRAAVVLNGFRRYCEAHPELLGEAEPTTALAEERNGEADAS